jgi:hypothetical protein
MPVKNSLVWAATTTAHGTWTFNRNGTGSAKEENDVIDFPPGIAPPGPAWLDSGPIFYTL